MTGEQPRHSYAGVFISFEGGDGTGKSTQINRLAERLREAGRDVVVTREPGGSPGAEAIRKLLVEGAADRWSPLSEALLMFAARADHLERTIIPALTTGAIVITDRFADSTMAYQGVAGVLGPEKVDLLRRLVVGENEPDLTIILDLPVAAGLERAGARGGGVRFESMGGDYQQAVRQAYLDIAANSPQRCAVIEARGGVEDVAARVMTVIKERLPDILTRDGPDGAK